MNDYAPMVFGPEMPAAFLALTRRIAAELGIPVTDTPEGGIRVHVADALTAHHVGWLTGQRMPTRQPLEIPQDMRWFIERSHPIERGMIQVVWRHTHAEAQIVVAGWEAERPDLEPHIWVWPVADPMRGPDPKEVPE